MRRRRDDSLGVLVAIGAVIPRLPLVLRAATLHLERVRYPAWLGQAVDAHADDARLGPVRSKIRSTLLPADKDYELSLVFVMIKEEPDGSLNPSPFQLVQVAWT
jgi:hypothetical protein